MEASTPDEQQQTEATKESYSLARYVVEVSENEQGIPEQSWKCIDGGAGVEDVFVGHTFNGDVDWADSGIYLAKPDNAEMSVTFRIHPFLLQAEQTELNLIIGLKWL